MSVFPQQEYENFGGAYDRIAAGIDTEQIQRAALASIMKNIDEVTKQMQELWDKRDSSFSLEVGTTFNSITLPQIKKENFFTGEKPSFVEAPLDMWPGIVVHCSDSKPDTFQLDQIDINACPLVAEIYCKAGPITEIGLHKKEGLKAEQELDSIVQRMADVVHLCLKHNPSLGGAISGEIQKSPSTTQSLPWSRKENSQTGTGNFYIFQAKQLQYTVSKNSY